MWIPPMLSAVAGANAAVTALIARTDAAHDSGPVLMIAACAGIIVSWMLLQIGFADAYELVDVAAGEEGLGFPDDKIPNTFDYLYFSFTIGTSFATSDVEVRGFRTRRVVLVHSVVSFFYNALVVAVAFQILQGLVSS